MNCPNCHSKHVRRERRSAFQRLIISSRKYKCFNCRTTFLYVSIVNKAYKLSS